MLRSFVQAVRQISVLTERQKWVMKLPTAFKFKSLLYLVRFSHKMDENVKFKSE